MLYLSLLICVFTFSIDMILTIINGFNYGASILHANPMCGLGINYISIREYFID